ncbi:hypothetical protein CMQ_8290 [Grosmannia clavigera kw1407]|uniref:N-acetylglucosamine-induced protein 1 n=1 Tax=Grosmannia clavigera (strain kw1407 / UAMH 11150) TaxID=655863 RepID=F0XKV6_GROCL|nr:uncharacterized protein CMQ_8290 [Grosmannia clavigera kw1407]EFX01824.1 hypothetical protein CMQ_8290 [Grosmannia clavigera kw1407]
MGSIEIPYWQVNVPPEQCTVTCPDFLRGISARDVEIISTPSAACHTLSWDEARTIVAAGRLDQFQRSPTQLRSYLAYAWGLRQQYGSPVSYLLQERLRWRADEPAQGAAPFVCPSDVKVMCNDWPYGIDDRIVHLVVWTKFALEENPVTDKLADETRTAIDRYVNKTFGELPKDSYIWFKNWRSLKSILQIEHFHVMLFDPPQEFVDRVTDGDVPQFRRAAKDGR